MLDGEGLPVADGPLTRVALPDGQRIFAVARGRRQEMDGSWWYELEITLPMLADVRGRMRVLPSPARFWASASDCSPIAGQDYTAVPTERVGKSPAWTLEHRFDEAEATRYLVHRGDCRAGHGDHRPADDEQARTALRQRDAVPCPVCRPDRVLLRGHQMS